MGDVLFPQVSKVPQQYSHHDGKQSSMGMIAVVPGPILWAWNAHSHLSVHAFILMHLQTQMVAR